MSNSIDPENDLPPQSPVEPGEDRGAHPEPDAHSLNPLEEAFREETVREQTGPVISLSPLSYVAPLPDLELQPDLAPQPDLAAEPDLALQTDVPLEDQPMFQSWSQPEFHRPVRIPHMGHVAILAVFAFFGLMGATLGIRWGLKAHLYGVTTMAQAITDIHFTLGSEVILYLLTFAACLIFFPMIWQKGFFAGIQWNGATALHLRQRLFITAAVCFALALINGLLLPGPSDAPIDKIFRAPGAAWLLFAFGVTFAPFFEEMVFRGFLLPALCTACDWTDETLFSGSSQPSGSTARSMGSAIAMTVVCAAIVGTPIGLIYAISIRSVVLFLVTLPIAPVLFLWLFAVRKPAADFSFRPLDETDQPRWSIPAMVIASIFTSVPFAGMHAAQTGYSLGPFILLIGVSLALCWARLSTRSLAASVMVHASYNFLLFFLMAIGTEGFKHLDKM